MTDVLWTVRGVLLPGPSRARLDIAALDVRSGVTAVLGGSGAGKTTLLNLLVGFEKPPAGSVAMTAADPLRPRVFWAPSNGGLWPHLTVRGHLEAVGADHDALRWLDRLGLTHLAEDYPATLSAGEQDRLNVARALAFAGERPAMLVMDEPLVHVDGALADSCWQVVRDEVGASGSTLVFSTHQPEVALREASRAVYLCAGRVLAEGPVMELYWRPTSEAVARGMGRGNWLDCEDAMLWFGEEAQPHVVRPERLDLEPDDGAPLRLAHARQGGAAAESEIIHEPTGRRRRFWHRARWPMLPIGQRVALRVLSILMLAFLLAACDGETAALAVRQVKHFPFPPEGSRVPAPRSVTIGPGDQVLVLDTAGRVLIFDADGALQRQWAMPSNVDGNPEGACFLKDGRIAVADTHYHRVLFFDESGAVVGEWGTRTRTGEPGTFEFPVSIVQDDAGFIYVAEYGGFDRVQKFTPEGEFVLQFGKPGTGPGEFQRCAGLAWHEGKLYVADASNGRIQVFTEQGKFVEVLGRGGQPARFRFPYDVAVGHDGSVFVVEWGAGCVTRLTSEGKLLGRWGTPGKGLDQLRTPWGLGVDSTMRVWVADTENRRLVALGL